MIYARVHDQTMADNYYTAMSQVEKRLDLLGTQEKDQEQLAVGERSQLLALTTQLAYPEEANWSPLVDTQITVQTIELLQVVDLASNVVVEARFGSQHPIDSPSWSPDGERLAFTAHDGSDSEIHALNLASGEVLQLIDNEVDDFMPAWQP